MALLDRMKQEMPEIWNQAQVVGKWVWLEFNVPPLQEIRSKLKELGFHWNGARKCWQHPCGDTRQNTGRDPRQMYKVTPATAMAMQEAAAKASMPGAKEYKIVALRECPLPESLSMCDTPDRAADYWRLNIATNTYVNPEVECLAVLMLNTRRRVKGHQLISLGTMDTLLVHPREVFRVSGRSKGTTRVESGPF